jgi:predicted NAD/FAD-binding protein
MSIPGEASSAMALLVQASPIDSINCLLLAVGASVVRSGMLHRDRSLYPRASRARSKSAIVVTWQGMRPRPKDSSVQKALPLERAT